MHGASQEREEWIGSPCSSWQLLSLLWDAAVMLITPETISLTTSLSDPALLLIRYGRRYFLPSFFFFFVSSEEGIFVWSLKSGKELIMKMGKSLASGILMFTLVSLSIFSVWILVKSRLLVFTLLTPILELKLLPPKISRCLTNFLTLTSILEIQWFQQVT